MTGVSFVVSLPLSRRFRPPRLPSLHASYPRYFVHGTRGERHFKRLSLSLPPTLPPANGTGCERGASSLRRPGYPSRLIKGLIVQGVHENSTKKRQPAAVNYFTQNSSLLI